MILKYNYHVIPGHRSRPGFVHGSLSAHWSPKERAAFMPRLVPTFGQIGGTAHFRSRPKCVRFVHSSPLPLQKDCGSVKASWTERRRASQEMGQPVLTRVTPASVHKSTPAPKMYSTVRAHQRAGGNTRKVFTFKRYAPNVAFSCLFGFFFYSKKLSETLFTQH
jgi:hypothetical protein